MKQSTIDYYRDVYNQQGGDCIICGYPLDPNGEDWSREHFWPRSRGGTEIVLAHEYCNSCKNDRDPTAEEMERYNEWYTFAAERAEEEYYVGLQESYYGKS